VVRTALLTVGRFPKALTLARALHRNGVKVIVADPLRRQLCSVSRAVTKNYQVTAPNADIAAWQQDILAIIEREGVTDLIPASEEICHVANLVERLPPEVRYVGPSSYWITQWHDKLLFVDHAIARGVTAPSVFTSADPETRTLIRQTDCVLKPRRGCSGTEVSFIDRGSSPPALSHEMLSLKRWIDQFLADTGVTGFISFDFILDHGGVPWGIECNPRLSSGIHFFDEAWLGAAVIGKNIEPAPISTAGKRAQWSYSTLTEAYKHLFRFQLGDLLRCLRDLLTSRDAVWSWRDPLPFLLMTPLCWEFIWRSIRQRITIGDASQCDIAWHWFEQNGQGGADAMEHGEQREA
jgi:hypothetical protein